MQEVQFFNFFWYVACEKNHMMEAFSYYEWYSIFFFTSFFVSQTINSIFFLVIFCNYVNIVWELYAQRVRGNNYEVDNDSMKMCFKHKTRMKVDHKNKNN